MVVADEPEGGDAVCWLHELCPACGAVPSPESPGQCWRCGTAAGSGADDRPHGSSDEHPVVG